MWLQELWFCMQAWKRYQIVNLANFQVLYLTLSQKFNIIVCNSKALKYLTYGFEKVWKGNKIGSVGK